MSLINIQSIEFKNILSYGNSITKFDFELGLNGVTGKNGNGKSAFLTDTICYALYGKPYRDIKMDELINNRNKKSLWVKILFQKSGKTYEIQRGIKPDLLTISEGGKELELASSKALIQEEIDKILGVNYKLFKNIIALSINTNKPFLKLDSKDKREIIESIFNIKIFGDMLKIVKKDTTLLKSSYEIAKNDSDIRTSTLAQSKTQYDKMELACKDFEKNKLQSIEVKQSDLKTLENDIKEIDAQISAFEQVINELGNVSDLENNLKISEQKVTEFRTDISNLNAQISFAEREIKNSSYSDYEEVSSIDKLIISKKQDSAVFKTKNDAFKFSKEDEYNSKARDLQTELKQVKQKLAQLDDKFVVNNLFEQVDQDKTESLKFNKNKRKEIHAEIEKMKNLGEGNCSRCNQVLTKEHLDKEILELTNKFNELTDYINADETYLRNKLKELSQKYKDENTTALNIVELAITDNTNKFMEDKLIESKLFYEKYNKAVEDFDKEIENLELQKSESVKTINKHKIANLEMKKDELSKIKDSYLTESQKLDALKVSLKTIEMKTYEKNLLQNNLSTKTSKIDDILIEIGTIKESKFNFDLAELESQLKQNKDELDLVNESLLKISENIKTNKILDKILSEDGIKTYFINSILGNLNMQINNYLDLFNLPIKIEFDNTLEANITDSYNKSRSYESFSSGEQKRIDLSIILSFIKINKSINNFDCNVMVMDEILDSSIDNDGLELVIESISEMVEREKIGVYVISHRAVQSAYFNKFFNIEKVDGFSKIGVL